MFLQQTLDRPTILILAAAPLLSTSTGLDWGQRAGVGVCETAGAVGPGFCLEELCGQEAERVLLLSAGGKQNKGEGKLLEYM